MKYFDYVWYSVRICKNMVAACEGKFQVNLTKDVDVRWCVTLSTQNRTVIEHLSKPD